MRKKIIKIFLIIIIGCTLTGCLLTKENRQNKKEYERTGKELAQRYIENKYNFNAKVKSVKVLDSNSWMGSLGSNYVPRCLVTMEYNNKEFLVYVDIEGNKGLDNYQFEEIKKYFVADIEEISDSDLKNARLYYCDEHISFGDNDECENYNLTSAYFNGNNYQEILKNVRFQLYYLDDAEIDSQLLKQKVHNYNMYAISYVYFCKDMYYINLSSEYPLRYGNNYDVYFYTKWISVSDISYTVEEYDECDDNGLIFKYESGKDIKVSANKGTEFSIKDFQENVCYSHESYKDISEYDVLSPFYKVDVSLSENSRLNIFIPISKVNERDVANSMMVLKKNYENGWFCYETFPGSLYITYDKKYAQVWVVNTLDDNDKGDLSSIEIVQIKIKN